MKRWQRAMYQPGIGLGENGSRVTECEEHRMLSKEAAKEGMVLLKNLDNVLPLKKGSRIALFGKASIDYVKGGGGSGDVTVSYIKNIKDGFVSLGDHVSVYPDTISFYEKEVKRQYDCGVAPGMTKEPELSDDMYRTAGSFADTAVISICRFSGEGWDRKSDFDKDSDLQTGQPENTEQESFEDGDFYLTKTEKIMIEQVKKYFPKVVAVLNVGGMVDTSWFVNDDKIQSVLMAWQGGMEGGIAEAELLCGIGNPSGKLADTFAGSLNDYPSSYNFHESPDYVDYTDDVYVGYRYFETIPDAGAKVNYPFGFGLSYTSFEVHLKSARIYARNFEDEEVLLAETKRDDAQIIAKSDETDKIELIDKNEEDAVLFAENSEDGKLIISGEIAPDVVLALRVSVLNKGKMAGREVIQVYGGAEAPLLGKPKKNLLAFEKTRLLQPGEKQTLCFRIRLDAMASFDDLGKIRKSAYVLEKGDYSFFIGTSVRDVSEVCSFCLEENAITRQLTSLASPACLKERMTADGTMESLSVEDADSSDNQSQQNGADENDLEFFDMAEVDGLTPAARAVNGVLLWSWKYKPDIRPFTDVVDGKMTVKEFLAQMTDEEIAHLLGGQPNTGVSNTFGIGNMPEYGIPNITTADGPAGLRIEPDCGVNTTALPCASLLACTWNPELIFRVGEAGAKEVKENNISVWLTPAVNIHRSPLCGRNFEYYSEDPYLAGKMAAAMVSGIQSQNIAATVKHFALNNKETNRKNSDSRVSERALREIYLRAFRIIVKEAEPWCIMTSYNIVNGRRASENSELIQGILRGEWGYKGLVMSDWWTFGEHYKEVKAGNDLKMACGFPERLLEAKEKGLLDREEMENCAEKILELILKID